MKKTTIRCPYCGAKATLRPSTAVYGERAKEGSYLYICDRYPKCDAYVGAHQKTNSLWEHWQTATFAIRELKRIRSLDKIVEKRSDDEMAGLPMDAE